jgi:hypothetical protein
MGSNKEKIMDNKKDLDKAERLWQSMNDANGENKPFPTEQVASVMSSLYEQYANEDPNTPVCCNECGQYAPSSEVSFWGLCSYCQPRPQGE